jgi:hypothetical protein
MGNPVGVKSVMRSTVSKYEQEQKEKFIQVMSDPRMRYSDALNFVENEIKQSKRMGTFNHKILCFMNDGVYNQDFLNAQPAVQETNYLRHVRFEKPVIVKMDGKKKLGVVLMPGVDK